MQSNRQRRLAHFGERAAIEIRKGEETPRISSDDSEHQRQAVTRRTQHGLRGPADADPGLKPAGFGFRIDALIIQRRPRSTAPGDRLLLENSGEQIELLVEQLLVFVELEA